MKAPALSGAFLCEGLHRALDVARGVEQDLRDLLFPAWPQAGAHGRNRDLVRISPSPVIELNHAAAVSMVDGPERALQLIDALEARGALKGYELLPAVPADLLRRLGRHDAAREAYLAASAATQLEPLRRLYARRLVELKP